MRRPLRVASVGSFYGSVQTVLDSLALHYDVTPDDASPELVLCGDDYGAAHAPHPQALKVQVLHENRYPDFSRFHYVIGLRALDHPRWFRQPLYVRTSKAHQLVKGPDYLDRMRPRKQKFCALVATNANKVRVWRRLAAADALDRARPLAFGGPYRNTTGGPVRDKFAFYSPFRFAVAFENGGMRGHSTEKITDAMIAGTIPLYWGNPDIAREFNPKSFVSAYDFDSLDAFVSRAMEIESSPALYEQMLAEPWFHGDVPNEHFDPARLGAFLHRAVEAPRPVLYPVYPPYRLQDWSRKIGFVADWALGKAGLAGWRS